MRKPCLVHLDTIYNIYASIGLFGIFSDFSDLCLCLGLWFTLAYRIVNSILFQSSNPTWVLRYMPNQTSEVWRLGKPNHWIFGHQLTNLWSGEHIQLPCGMLKRLHKSAGISYRSLIRRFCQFHQSQVICSMMNIYQPNQNETSGRRPENTLTGLYMLLFSQNETSAEHCHNTMLPPRVVKQFRDTKLL
jgi:hypothetical protein